MTISSLEKQGYDLTAEEVEALNDKLIKEFKAALDDMKDASSRVYSGPLGGVDKADYLVEMNKGKRFSKYRADIKQTFDAIWRKAVRAIVEGSEISFINNYYRQQYALNWMLTDPYFKNVNLSAVTSSVLGTYTRKEYIPFIPKYGKLLDTLKANRSAYVSRLDSIITQGVIQGKGADEVGREISKVLNISVNKAITVSRTEMQRNLNSGAYSIFADMTAGGIPLERRLIATLDTRTRKQSGDMDGQVATEKGFKYPNGVRYLIPGNTGHPEWDINDRETVTTVTEGDSPNIRSGRNPDTGKTEIMDYGSFDDWMTRYGLTRTASGKIVKK